MIPVYKLTKSLAIGIVASWLLPIAASAKDFKIGEVRKKLQTDYICVTSFPNEKGIMVLVDSGSKHAWVNIDGSDIRLIQASSQVVKPNKRTIIKYRNKNIALTVDSKYLRTIAGALDSSEFLDRVTFKVGSQSKTIQAKGSCT
jgi:hypothetical protein